ncbi:hypothetical protein U1Q18_024449 [Sarracenia purpurea var. burkii]
MGNATKRMIVFCLGALLLCSLISIPVDAEDISSDAMFVDRDNGSNGNYISYSAMAADRIPNRLENVLGSPANQYQRGCEDIDRCRH